MKKVFASITILFSFLSIIVAQNIQPNFVMTSKIPAADINEEVEIDVTVQNFNEISGFTFNISWDDSHYAYKEIKNFNLGGLTAGSCSNTNNNISVLWICPTGLNYTLDEDTKLFTVVLTSLKKDWVKDVCFTQAPAVVEVTSDLNPIKVTFTGLNCSFISGAKDILNNSLSKVYPNPFTNNLSIELDYPLNEDADISVIDLLGKTVINETKSLSSGFQKLDLNTENLPSGQYILAIKTSQGVISNKIIKQ